MGHEVRWFLLVQQPSITIALYIAAFCHEIALLYNALGTYFKVDAMVQRVLGWKAVKSRKVLFAPSSGCAVYSGIAPRGGEMNTVLLS